MGKSTRTKPPCWRFPEIDGFVVRNETGDWSETEFWNAQEPDDPIPEVLYQAPPHEANRDAEDWRRWVDYLESAPNAAQALLKLALFEARRKLFEAEDSGN